MIKISVIIPVYNTEKYLRECLESVINQTLKDIEIICIDDGSTDSSLDILKEYAEIDSRIKVLSQKNKGVGACRNDGIKISSGEFVCFLDADDYYQYDNNLELLYTKIKTNNAIICGGEFSHLWGSDITQEKTNSFYGYGFEKEGFIKYKDWQFDYGYHRFLYNRKFLLKNNIVYPNYKRFQDPPFFVKAMFLAKDFYAVTQSTYLLRCGHKQVNWDNTKQIHLLNGIYDNLKFAKYNKLNHLYYLTAERLNQHVGVFLNKKLSLNVYIKLLWILLFIDIRKIRKINNKYEINEYYKKIKKWYLNIFSIQNSEGKTHKIITILGIKIKIKRRS